MSGDWHHHHEGEDSITFCAIAEEDCADVLGTEDEPLASEEYGVICSGRIWRGGQWVSCHYRLTWRAEPISSDMGQEIPMFTQLQAVPDGEVE